MLLDRRGPLEISVQEQLLPSPCFCLFVFQPSFLHLCLKPAPFTKLPCNGRAWTPKISRKKCLSGRRIQESCIPRNVEKIHLIFLSFSCHFPLRVKVIENCEKVQETKTLHKSLAFQQECKENVSLGNGEHREKSGKDRVNKEDCLPL